MFSIRKGFNVEVALSALSHSREIIDARSCKLIGDVSQWESYFLSAIDAPKLSGAVKRMVVRKAIHSSQDLDRGSLLRALENAYREISSKGENRFKVVFPVVNSEGLLFGKKKHDSVGINFQPNFEGRIGRNILNSRIEQRKDHGEDSVPGINQASDVQCVVLSVNAIDVFDAFERSNRVISRLLGIYALFDRRGPFIIPHNPRIPISRMFFAPHISVHLPTGRLAADIVWFNPWITHQRSAVRREELSAESAQRLNSSFRKIATAARKSAWLDEANIALEKFFIACSSPSPEDSFLDLWRVLEFIGGDSQANGSTLIARASAFFEDPSESLEIGRHLQARRNAISHGHNTQSDDMEDLRFQAYRFIRPMLMNYIVNPFGFRNLKEFYEFCDLPLSREVRDRKAKILADFSKFRRE